MAEAKESLPNTDDIPAEVNNGLTENELLDAVMAQSQFVAESLPDEEIPEVGPSESDTEDPYESDEVVNGDEKEVGYEDEETEDEDAAATQETAVYSTEDLDLDAKVIVKIDGKEQEVSFSDLIKGYSTEQSLSNKGRELGEARKELEAERETQLTEINKLGQASAAVLLNGEQNFAKAYHDIEAKISKARADGDTFELSELKDQREIAQQNYWKARKTREGLVKNIEQQQDNINEGYWNEVNDYRLLKQGVTKGQAKRKSTPSKKVPIKKAKSSTKAQSDQDAMVKARAFKSDSSNDDQMAFLKQLASRSLGN